MNSNKYNQFANTQKVKKEKLLKNIGDKVSENQSYDFILTHKNKFLNNDINLNNVNNTADKLRILFFMISNDYNFNTK